MDFRFDDILPYLASAYRRGVLVPFIGSGMSVPTCTGWISFLVKLADESGAHVPEKLRQGPPWGERGPRITATWASSRTR